MFSRALGWMRSHIVLAAVLLCMPLVAAGAQVAADSGVTAPIPVPDAHAQFVLGLAALASFIGAHLSSLLLNQWNKAGGWLEHQANGLKQILAVVFAAAGGLLINALAALLTHSTNWIVTFVFSVIAGTIQTVSAGMTIDATKSKLAAKSAPPGSAMRHPSGF